MSGHPRVKEFGGQVMQKGAPTEAELAILANDLFAGSAVTAADVHVRRMALCHDQYDRTYERFPKGVLQRFKETLPGRSVLANHNAYTGADGLPLGRFFNTAITAKQEEEFPVPVRGRTRRRAAGDACPPGFTAQPQRVNWLMASWYFANTPENEAMRQNIDLGVWKWVSIGFRFDDLVCDLCNESYWSVKCPHILGRTYAEDPDSGATSVPVRLCTATYGGDMEFYEALEGSIVYLGAQPRARLMKAMVEHREVDVDALCSTPYGTDPVALKEAEDLARRYGAKRKIFGSGSVEVDELDAEAKLESEPAHVGLSFADHTAAVLGAVGEYVERCAAIRGQRTADGKKLGHAWVARVREVKQQLDDVLTLAAEPAEPAAAPAPLTVLAAKRDAIMADVDALPVAVLTL